jgi:hypothetical protein
LVQLAARDATDAAIAKPGTPIVRVDELGERFPHAWRAFHNGQKPASSSRSGRKPFPAHLPRERVVVPAPSACACCGSTKLAKLGETITETLESIPRQWKVIQTVREKFTCRECEKITSHRHRSIRFPGAGPDRACWP